MPLCLADPRCPLPLRKLLQGHKFPQLSPAAGGTGSKVNSGSCTGENGFPSKRGPSLQREFCCWVRLWGPPLFHVLRCFSSQVPGLCYVS